MRGLHTKRFMAILQDLRGSCSRAHGRSNIATTEGACRCACARVDKGTEKVVTVTCCRSDRSIL